MNIHSTLKSVLCAALIFTFINTAQSATITVDGTDGSVAPDGFCSITEAILAANINLPINECPSGSGIDTDIINLSTNITLTTEGESDNTYGRTGTPAIDSILILNGNGFSITRDNLLCNPNDFSASTEFRIIRVDASGDLTLNNITLSNGCVDGSGFSRAGGAISNGGVLSIVDSTFSGNTAYNGGALHNYGTINMIQNSTFSGNPARFDGGGINNEGIITTIQNTTFSGNSTPSDGGGIYNNGSINTIQNSTFSANSADQGAGITNNGSITTIQNTTFSGNSSAQGSGIRNNSSSTISTIQNTTFSGNVGTTNAAINNVGTISMLRNSLFHDNGIFECSSTGGTFNGFNNLTDNVSNNSNCPGLRITAFRSYHIAPLADNGGPTMTHALLVPPPNLFPNSAIDFGNGQSTTTDQRGFAASGIRDIGAYEHRPLDLCSAALKIDGFTTSVANSTDLNLAIVCANANGSGTDTINLTSDVTILDSIFTVITNTSGYIGLPLITSPIIIDGMDFNIKRWEGYACELTGSDSDLKFRLITILASGDLTLKNTTLSNGCADGGFGFDSKGGAVYNDGALSLVNLSLIHI